MTGFLSLGERTAVGAKAHVFFGRLLTDESYWRLLHCDTIQEIVEYLKSLPGFAPHLLSISPEIHRAELEDVLEMLPLRETLTFFGYLTGEQRAYVRCWIDLYEADLLKRAMRSLFSRKQDREQLRQRFALIPKPSFSSEALLSSGSYEEFLEALSGSGYYRVLREPLTKLAGEGGSLFSAETAVDLHVLSALFRAAGKVDPRNGTGVLSLVGTMVDLLNVSWLHRSARFFDMHFEEMLNRLLPVRHRLGLPFLRKLSRAENPEAFWDLLRHSCYGGALGESLPKEDFELETRMKQHLWRQAKQLFRRSGIGFHSLVAYLFLRRYEIQDLKTIIEDVRYDFDRRGALLFMVRPIVPGGERAWRW